MIVDAGPGGYEAGYLACPCFWGREPGSLIRRLERELGSFAGLRALDAGCGEGKNAAYLADRGARVRALELSARALENARGAWPRQTGVEWEQADIRAIDLPEAHYDVVVAYGLLHCLADAEEVVATVARLQRASEGGVQAGQLSDGHLDAVLNEGPQVAHLSVVYLSLLQVVEQLAQPCRL